MTSFMCSHLIELHIHHSKSLITLKKMGNLPNKSLSDDNPLPIKNSLTPEYDDFISLVTDTTFLAASSKYWDSEILSLYVQLLSANRIEDTWRLSKEIHSCKPKVEFASLTDQIHQYFEWKLEWKLLSLFTQIVSLLRFMDLDSQPKPEPEIISLIKKIISFFNSKPDHSESELVSLITQTIELVSEESELLSLISQIVSLIPEPELTSLITRIISRFKDMNWEPRQFCSFCPQAHVRVLEQGRFCPVAGVRMRHEICPVGSIQFWRSERYIDFFCRNCNGDNHGDYGKAPVQIKHSFHPQHSLQLVFTDSMITDRECYCCDEFVHELFYYCEACDYAMNIVCAEKPPPVLSIDYPKRHQHPLVPFPSNDSLTCHLCSLKDTKCMFYVCPPCGFVVHQKCLSLPYVIKISRHPHRISFTSSFDKGDWFCSVCRRNINNDHGGYTCIKDGCLYAVHSKCATQRNVWDGIELEGVLDDIEEELEPFVRISDGIIMHFSHQHHHLRLDENTVREYDENKLCQACVMPIYFGNFYSCMTCEFILHEDCANLARKIHHAIHPHMLTLVGAYDCVMDHNDRCSACRLVCLGGFFYECRKEEFSLFRLHVRCATISEPLVHESHKHPLFLTSKPTEVKTCSVCEDGVYQPFNCIEECEFSLCFKCATIPRKVRYKHDKHILFLCHGEETCTEKYWCEACEKEINPKKRFYKCDEYCCVTLHIECLIGKDLYMKPDSLYDYFGTKAVNVANNPHMTRPFCSSCYMRCPFTIVFKCDGRIYCSRECLPQRSSL